MKCKLITAKQAYEKSVSNVDEIAFMFIDDLKNTLIDRLGRHVKRGELTMHHASYTFYQSCSTKIMARMPEIQSIFQDAGYIFDYKLKDYNGVYSQIIINISWDLSE